MVEYESEINGECIFCKIAKKEIEPMSNGLFYESEKYLAWLSPFPCIKGFSIVIPKKHFGSDVLAMPEKDLTELVLEAKKVAKILEEKIEGVGRVGLIMEGTGIDHAHIKLFPMVGTECLKDGKWEQFQSGKNMFFEKYEGYLVSCDGPKADPREIKKLAKKLSGN